jgi:hypothetical protein
MFLSCFAFFNLILAGRGIFGGRREAVGENEEAQRKRERFEAREGLGRVSNECSHVHDLHVNHTSRSRWGRADIIAACKRADGGAQERLCRWLP